MRWVMTDAGWPKFSSSISGASASPRSNSPDSIRARMSSMMKSRFMVAMKRVRRPGQLGGPTADPVDLDVVGVAVAAVVVVVGEDVGLLLVEDRGPGAGPPASTSACQKRGGVVVGRLAHHPGVDVAEELDPLGAEELGRAVGLGDATQAQRLAVVEDAGHDLAVLAPGGHDQRDPVALGRGLGHGPAGLDGLVVGMGVEGRPGRPLRPPLPQARRRGDRRRRRGPASARTSSVCWPACGGRALDRRPASG